jgi:hypothetical protein
MMTARAWMGRGALRVVLGGSLVASLVLGSAVSAAADMEQSKQAKLLVLQSISLIANDAPRAAVLTRLNDALDAPDQEGVDRAKVIQALALIKSGPSGLVEARQLLVGAIAVRAASGYGTIPMPGKVGQDVAPRATGAEPGTTVVLDELQPARGVNDRSDAAVLLAGVLMVAAGVYLARRWRPDVSINELRRMSDAAQAGESA